MLSECALALALDAEKLPKTSGILTTASALGSVGIDRLRKAGMIFKVHDDNSNKQQ